jgi:hypothetical protein
MTAPPGLPVASPSLVDRCDQELTEVRVPLRRLLYGLGERWRVSWRPRRSRVRRIRVWQPGSGGCQRRPEGSTEASTRRASPAFPPPLSRSTKPAPLDHAPRSGPARLPTCAPATAARAHVEQLLTAIRVAARPAARAILDATMSRLVAAFRSWPRRWSPRPAGAAARRAERPTRVTGTIRPDPGSSWSARRPPTAPGAVPAGWVRRPRTNELDAGACRAGWYFPAVEGIGRTRPGAGSRPRRGRFRPPDRPRRA